MDNKKEQEREELHKSIWNIASELRGAVADIRFVLTYFQLRFIW